MHDYAAAWGGIRNALVLYLHQVREVDVLRALAGSATYGAEGLVVDVVTELAQENYRMAFLVLGDLVDTPRRQRDETRRLAKVEEDLRSLKRKLRKRNVMWRESRQEKVVELTAQRAALRESLRPLIKSKQAAIRSLYEVYRSRNYRDALDDDADPLELLWRVLADPLAAVRDDATRHIYYLWTERPATAFDILERLARAYLDSGRIGRYVRLSTTFHAETRNSRVAC